VGGHEVVSGHGLAVLLAFFLGVHAGPAAESDDSDEVYDDDGPIQDTDIHAGFKNERTPHTRIRRPGLAGFFGEGY
jgi:hypothetical protein